MSTTAAAPARPMESPPSRTRNGVELDLAYGTRPAETCPCGRHLPATDTPVFEIETVDGAVLCPVCLDKAHRPLRTAVLLLQAILDATRHGDHEGATDAVNAVLNGVQMLEETAIPVPYQRPVRHQPVRHNRRGRRR